MEERTQADVFSSGQGLVPPSSHFLVFVAARDMAVRRIEAASHCRPPQRHRSQCHREWVVYTKAPFGGPAPVLAYLANYTHRIAITNSHLLSFDGSRVTFRYRDSRQANAQKMMTLDADEFLRRFLMHVVPHRFVRIRYYRFNGQSNVCPEGIGKGSCSHR